MSRVSFCLRRRRFSGYAEKCGRLLVFLLMLSSCQAYNSASRDDQIFADAADAEAVARGVLSRQCGQCHAFHTTPLDTLTLRNYIVPGHPEQSLILQRSKGTGYGGNENMPPAGALSYDEIDHLNTWITNI